LIVNEFIQVVLIFHSLRNSSLFGASVSFLMGFTTYFYSEEKNHQKIYLSDV